MHRLRVLQTKQNLDHQVATLVLKPGKTVSDDWGKLVKNNSESVMDTTSNFLNI